MADKFCFPVQHISGGFLDLIPFSVSQHAEALYDLSKGHPDLWTNYPQGPYNSYQSFLNSFVHRFIAQSRQTLAFAIIDKTRNTLAGVTAYMEADKEARSVAIGLFIILPPYRETHVPTNAIFLMLRHALDPKTDGGFGLVRVQWRLDTLNKDLLHLARMMYFKSEGTMSWSRRIRNGVDRKKVGNRKPLPPGGVGGDVWQDIETYSMCLGDWLGAFREDTMAVMTTKFCDGTFTRHLRAKFDVADSGDSTES